MIEIFFSNLSNHRRFVHVLRRGDSPIQEAGFAIVENLVSMALLTITLIGSSSLFINAMQANTAARNYGALSSEVHTLIDNYRALPYTALLTKISPNFTGITDGQTGSESTTSAASRATITTTFQAIKSNPKNIPEAVKVSVSALERRGRMRNATYTFETLVSQTK